MVTVDCTDPKRLEPFWTALLDAPNVFETPDLVVLRPKASGPNLGLQQVPEPKVGKNRAHVDLSVTDRAAEVARAIGLGASQLAEHDYQGFAWTVLADPESNEFCIAGGP